MSDLKNPSQFQDHSSDGWRKPLFSKNSKLDSSISFLLEWSPWNDADSFPLKSIFLHLQ